MLSFRQYLYPSIVFSFTYSCPLFHPSLNTCALEFPHSSGLIVLNNTSFFLLPPSQSIRKNKTNSKTSSSKGQRNFKENLQEPTQDLEGWRRSNELVGGGPENWLKELESLQMRKKEKGSDVQAYKAWTAGNSRAHMFKDGWKKRTRVSKRKDNRGIRILSERHHKK